MEKDVIWEDYEEMKYELESEGWFEFRQDGRGNERSTTEPNAQYKKPIHSNIKIQQ